MSRADHIQRRRNDSTSARRRATTYLPSFLRQDDAAISATILFTLGRLCFEEARFDEAAELLEECMVLFREIYAHRHPRVGSLLLTQAALSLVQSQTTR